MRKIITYYVLFLMMAFSAFGINAQTVVSSTYSGLLNIKMVVTVATDLEAEVRIDNNNDGTCTFTLPDFSVSGMTLGDIVVENVSMTTNEDGTAYSGAAEGLEFSSIVKNVNVTISGTISNDNVVDFAIAVTWGSVPVSVTFTSEGDALVSQTVSYDGYLSVPMAEVYNSSTTLTIEEDYENGSATVTLPNVDLQYYQLGEVVVEASVSSSGDVSTYSGSATLEKEIFGITPEVTLNGTVSESGEVEMVYDINLSVLGTYTATFSTRKQAVSTFTHSVYQNATVDGESVVTNEYCELVVSSYEDGTCLVTLPCGVEGLGDSIELDDVTMSYGTSGVSYIGSSEDDDMSIELDGLLDWEDKVSFTVTVVTGGSTIVITYTTDEVATASGTVTYDGYLSCPNTDLYNSSTTLTIEDHGNGSATVTLPNVDLQYYQLGEVVVEASVSSSGDVSTYSGSATLEKEIFGITPEVTLNGTVSESGEVEMVYDINLSVLGTYTATFSTRKQAVSTFTHSVYQNATVDGESVVTNEYCELVVSSYEDGTCLVTLPCGVEGLGDSIELDDVTMSYGTSGVSYIGSSEDDDMSIELDGLLDWEDKVSFTVTVVTGGSTIVITYTTDEVATASGTVTYDGYLSCPNTDLYNSSTTLTIEDHGNGSATVTLPNVDLQYYQLGEVVVEASVSSSGDVSTYSGSATLEKEIFGITPEVTLNGTVSESGEVEMVYDINLSVLGTYTATFSTRKQAVSTFTHSVYQNATVDGESVVTNEYCELVVSSYEDGTCLVTLPCGVEGLGDSIELDDVTMSYGTSGVSYIGSSEDDDMSIELDGLLDWEDKVSFTVTVVTGGSTIVITYTTDEVATASGTVTYDGYLSCPNTDLYNSSTTLTIEDHGNGSATVTLPNVDLQYYQLGEVVVEASVSSSGDVSTYSGSATLEKEIFGITPEVTLNGTVSESGEVEMVYDINLSVLGTYTATFSTRKQAVSTFTHSVYQNATVDGESVVTNEYCELVVSSYEDGTCLVTLPCGVEGLGDSIELDDVTMSYGTSGVSYIGSSEDDDMSIELDGLLDWEDKVSFTVTVVTGGSTIVITYTTDEVATTSVNNVGAANVTVYGTVGAIAIYGYTGVAGVYNVAGQIEKTILVDGSTILGMSKGVYIVRLDNCSVKVVVK